MASINIKLEYDLTLKPDELKLVLAALEGREFTEEQDNAATELAVKLRSLREANAKHVMSSMQSR